MGYMLSFVIALISRLAPTDLLAVQRAALLREIDERLFAAIEQLVRKAEKVVGLSGGQKMSNVLGELHMVSPIISTLVLEAGENLIRRAIELVVAEMK